LQSVDDLFVSVGYGKVSPHQILNKLLPGKIQEEQLPRTTRHEKEQKGISIKGIDHILYHTAKCCFPVPGDSLVGFVTRGKGVTIHRRDCPNLERLAIDDGRIVEVDWRPQSETTTLARLLVETVDRPGIIADVSALISSINVNINHMQATATQDKKAHITFNLEVRDKLQLSALIQKIAQTEGVLRVKR
ncbi:MAG TPA: ACT domain-containing protein, partial [Thermodesulfovibrionales bacterium]|nr:ACT domain-containing protein [Thermodesulfovibrionales bacterium]